MFQKLIGFRPIIVRPWLHLQAVWTSKCRFVEQNSWACYSGFRHFSINLALVVSILNSKNSFSAQWPLHTVIVQCSCVKCQLLYIRMNLITFPCDRRNYPIFLIYVTHIQWITEIWVLFFKWFFHLLAIAYCNVRKELQLVVFNTFLIVNILQFSC